MRLRDNYGTKGDNKYFNATTISYSGQVHRVNELIGEGYSIDKAVEQTLVQFAIPVNETSKFYLKERVEKYNEVLNSRQVN
jgi:signal transduction protein with GAF and PtsI domain